MEDRTGHYKLAYPTSNRSPGTNTSPGSLQHSVVSLQLERAQNRYHGKLTDARAKEIHVLRKDRPTVGAHLTLK